MVLSPTGDLRAVDGFGTVYYTMPYTNNVTPYAVEAEKRKAINKKKGMEKVQEKQIREIINAS